MTTVQIAFGEKINVVTPVVDDHRKLELKKRIIDILSRGKIVRFTNPLSGATKDVKEWNIDDHGDLEAFRYEHCMVPYVAWDSGMYDVTEVDE